MQQTTDAVLMIRPLRFGYNAEAAASNTHQTLPSESPTEIQARAADEFAGLVDVLTRHGICVHAFSDEPAPHTPDSIFPNNWFSTHDDGTLVLYPMAVKNRRAERRPRLVAELQRRLHIKRVLDLSGWEAREKYLEGTGSVILDRLHRIAYAARSVRTHEEVLDAFCAALDFRKLVFDTHERNGSPEYHTNVVMSVGERSAVICLEAIADAAQREAIRETLVRTGHTIVEISNAQMNAFAGNLLQLRNAQGARFWVMSAQAHAALDESQKRQLSVDAQLIFAPLATIEAVGGGSARCMLAELFFAAN